MSATSFMIMLYDSAIFGCWTLSSIRFTLDLPSCIRLSGVKTTRMVEWKCDFTTAHAIQFYVRGARCVLKAAAKLGTHQEQAALALIHCGITSKEVANVLEAAAEGLGYDGARFSTHSIRIGGATSLLNAGADRLVLKRMGRWLSNAFEPYPVLTAEGSSHLESLIC
ncbi:LOW QUALITY PROTEIN: hypothetical protein PHMEG_00034504 [Phytophthora megakarya]|uniref:Tyr recombinase domain-containing protein n=1 Tax=Phytophthora megakarya TaxID=4795 RepID=A0A225UR34_9STRA|nr:LOW QUALITY PROTEIN: hypothetical protein PHMEG_00034504 [Phytophthora megakarya]